MTNGGEVSIVAAVLIVIAILLSILAVALGFYKSKPGAEDIQNSLHMITILLLSIFLLGLAHIFKSW